MPGSKLVQLCRRASIARAPQRPRLKACANEIAELQKRLRSQSHRRQGLQFELHEQAQDCVEAQDVGRAAFVMLRLRRVLAGLHATLREPGVSLRLPDPSRDVPVVVGTPRTPRVPGVGRALLHFRCQEVDLSRRDT